MKIEIIARALAGAAILSGVAATAGETRTRAIKTHTICYGHWKAHSPHFDFIASHYDMVLDGEPGIVQGLTERNPKIGVLMYKIAQSMHDSYPDWKEADAHEDWFIHAKGLAPTKENRLRSAAYDEYMMDVTKTGWHDHYAGFVGEAMKNNPLFAGIFADNCWASFSTYPGKWYRIIAAEKHATGGAKGETIRVDFPVAKRRRGPTPIRVHNNSRLEGPNFYDEAKGCSWKENTIVLNANHLPGPPGAEVWVSCAAVCSPPDHLVKGWEDGITAIVTKAKAALPGKLLIGNSGGRLYCERYLDAMDGIFVEAFIHAPWGAGDRAVTEQQWVEEIEALVRAQNKNKWHMCHSGSDPSTSTPEQMEQWRLFCYASFLLGTGVKATFQFAGETNSRAPSYWPEWDLPIGEPKGSYTVTKIGGCNIYQREFGNGKVIVNPSDASAPVAVALGGRYRDPKGQAVQEVELRPKHGAVLLRANDACLHFGGLRKFGGGAHAGDRPWTGAVRR